MYKAFGEVVKCITITVQNHHFEKSSFYHFSMQNLSLKTMSAKKDKKHIAYLQYVNFVKQW